MLNISVTLKNERLVISGLNRLDKGIEQKALPRALRKIGSGVARISIDLLTGSRRGVQTIKSRNGIERTVIGKSEAAGEYPVPRVVGHLRRMLQWIGPGRSKSIDGVSFTTGLNEAVVFNTARYASQIHEGKGSSAKYGPRPFIDDAFKRFDTRGAVEKEVKKETDGFK